MYSIGGLKRLWAETAFRHEVLVIVVVLAGLFLFGASLLQILIATILLLLLIATEALNTALECIVDHVSPAGRNSHATPRTSGRWRCCASCSPTGSGWSRSPFR